MRRVRAIEEQVLEMINASSRSVDPNEFLCMMRAEEGVIVELVLLPGTVSGDSHGIIDVWMAPVDFSLCGSVHSHPGPSNEPSDDDLQFFRHWGGVHIISCRPYDTQSWRAYDSNGRMVSLEVIP
ncbi:MAG: Mov34/MPN/PAD-1 family protein [Candidatus Methanomethylophilaceae archaeon]|jgi:proteasome lid subunit RPN8/RPN11